LHSLCPKQINSRPSWYRWIWTTKRCAHLRNTTRDGAGAVPKTR